MKLEEWRSEIDEIDSEIVALLERRAKVARKIGVLKAHAGLAVVDPGREETVIRRITHLSAKGSGALSRESLTRIYQRILQESRSVQVDAITSVTAAAQNTVEV